MDKQQVLKNITLFKALSEAELTELSSFIKTIKFSANTRFIHQGKPGEGMFVIKKGKVQVNVRLPGNSENKIAVLEETNFVGEVALIEGGPTVASVISLSETECYFLSCEVFHALQICKPLLTHKIMVAINQEVCARLRQINDEIAGNLIDVNKAIAKSAKPKLSKSIPASVASLKAVGINTDFLMTLGIFKHFKAHEVAELLSYMQIRQANKGDLIFKEGDNTDNFYLVAQGAVQVVLAKKNKLAKLSVNGPGNICGQLSYIDNKVGTATGIAREDVVLLEIKQTNISRLKHNNSELFYKWYAAISQPFVSMLRTALKDLTRLATHADH